MKASTQWSDGRTSLCFFVASIVLFYVSFYLGGVIHDTDPNEWWWWPTELLIIMFDFLCFVCAVGYLADELRKKP